MAAVRIIGKSQRVVDAPGLSIDELAGQFYLKYFGNYNLQNPYHLSFQVHNIATKDDRISIA